MDIVKAVQGAALVEIQVVVLDVDNTLYYTCQRYSGEGRGYELAAIAQQLGVTVDQANKRIEGLRAELTRVNGGRDVTRTEIILALHLPLESPLQWWNSVRESCYRPEKWLKPNPEITKAVRTLGAEFTLAAASNSPHKVMHRALGTIDLRKRFKVTWAPEDGSAKHDPEHWRKLADRLGVPPHQCVSVGDRVEADCYPAIVAGFGGAIHVDGPADLPEVARYLLARKKI